MKLRAVTYLALGLGLFSLTPSAHAESGTAPTKEVVPDTPETTSRSDSRDLDLYPEADATLAPRATEVTAPDEISAETPSADGHRCPDSVDLHRLGPGRNAFRVERLPGQWVATVEPGQWLVNGHGPYRVTPKQPSTKHPCVKLVAPKSDFPSAGIPLVARSALPKGTAILGITLGRNFGDAGIRPGRLNLGGWSTELTTLVAITDRLQWPILPALVYQGGTAHELEYLPWGGLYSWGLSAEADTGVPIGFAPFKGRIFPDIKIAGFLGIGIDLRWWVTAQSSLTFSTSANSIAVVAVNKDSWVGPDTWRQLVAVGGSHTMGSGFVTFNGAVAWQGNWLYEGSAPVVAAQGRRFDMSVGIGSVQSRGTRLLPVIQVHLSDRWYVDVYGSIIYYFAPKQTVETFQLGLGYVIE